MDLLLAILTMVFVFFLLLTAAIKDYQTREVSNWIWLIGLFGLPFTIYRVGTTGLWLLFGFQAVLVFFLVIASFRLGFLGGADGKAILIISLLYPWILLDPVWLLIAPFVVLFGGFLLVGIHSIWLLLQNRLAWNLISRNEERAQKPERKIFWFTRRFSPSLIENNQWRQVEVPLVSYIFLVYTILVILTSVFL
ncbi:hypothetical protein E2P61_07570 [Candidatus Bathyarchaeota archaeon]|nr:hypothetical protein E2P61_07570 [Candidatus Bathyarchaeota archaeon]